MQYPMPRVSLIKTLSLTAMIAPLWAGTALAWTGEEVTNRLQNLLKQQMVELTFSKADVDGRIIVLRDAKIRLLLAEDTADTDDETAPLNLGDLTLDGITETADGSYVIDKTSLADTRIVEGDIVVTTAGIRIEKLKLTKDPKLDIMGRMEYLEGFHMGELSVAASGQSLFNLDDFYLTNEPYSKETPSNYSWGFKALDINLEEIYNLSDEQQPENSDAAEDESAEQTVTKRADPVEDTKVKTAVKRSDKRSDVVVEEEAEVTEPETETETETESTDEAASDTSDSLDIDTIRALGLEKIHLSMEAKGRWSPYSGQYDIDQFVLNGQNIGNFSYQLHMGGYDMKFIKAMQEFYANSMKEDDESTSMQISAMGLVQNLSISSMEMRYEDASFVNKLLTYEAEKQSVTREAYVQEMKDQLQAGLILLEGEPGVEQAAKAIGAFLDKPQSISLNVKPKQPVTFAILSAVAMSEPKKLWSVLGVSIEANK